MFFNFLKTKIKDYLLLIALLLSFSFESFAQEPDLIANFVKHTKLSLPQTIIEKRILREYGALWLNPDTKVKLPPKLIFESEAEVAEFHKTLKIASIGKCRLQEAAVASLKLASQEAGLLKFTISPRGSDSCLRDFATTHMLWLSRVEPNLAYYVSQKKLSQPLADKIQQAPLKLQVEMILSLEENKGLLFDKYRQTSILNSVAAPGTSQHLSGLAFDVKEFENPKVRSLLNKYGWYQTVVDDQPHFTYLGKPLTESELKGRGLKKIVKGQFTFWVPDL